MDRKIEYNAVVALKDGREFEIDLDRERGWMSRPEISDIVTFTLKPVVVHLPVVCVDLSPLSDGTPKRLVYFSRPHGKIASGSDGGSGLCELFRLYCVGWQATVEGCNIKSLLWIYPNGSIVVADEPKFVDDMLEFYWRLKLSQKGQS